MALSKEQKTEVVAEAGGLLNAAKLTVIAKYSGTSVTSMQQLRKEATDKGTRIKIIKNRLFKIALAGNPKFKDIDPGFFNGQLLYAFNAEDEVAPAQSLASFAKKEPQIEFIGGLTADGQFLTADDVKALANLPAKDQLRGQLASVMAAPLANFVSILSGNSRSLLNVLMARAEQVG